MSIKKKNFKENRNFLTKKLFKNYVIQKNINKLMELDQERSKQFLSYLKLTQGINDHNFIFIKQKKCFDSRNLELLEIINQLEESRLVSFLQIEQILKMNRIKKFQTILILNLLTKSNNRDYLGIYMVHNLIRHNSLELEIRVWVIKIIYIIFKFQGILRINISEIENFLLKIYDNYFFKINFYKNILQSKIYAFKF